MVKHGKIGLITLKETGVTAQEEIEVRRVLPSDDIVIIGDFEVSAI